MLSPSSGSEEPASDKMVHQSLRNGLVPAIAEQRTIKRAQRVTHFERA